MTNSILSSCSNEEPSVRRRVRVPIACTKCRHRRIRCFTKGDGTPCQRCVKRNFLCEYIPVSQTAAANPGSVAGARRSPSLPLSTSSGTDNTDPDCMVPDYQWEADGIYFDCPPTRPAAYLPPGQGARPQLQYNTYSGPALMDPNALQTPTATSPGFFHHHHHHQAYTLGGQYQGGNNAHHGSYYSPQFQPYTMYTPGLAIVDHVPRDNFSHLVCQRCGMASSTGCYCAGPVRY